MMKHILRNIRKIAHQSENRSTFFGFAHKKQFLFKTSAESLKHL